MAQASTPSESGGGGAPEMGGPPGPPPGPPPVQVEIRKIRSGPLQVTVNTLGTAMPYREAKVAVVQDGLVKSVLFNEGQAVKKGQVLVQLDDTVLQARKREKEAESARLQAELDRLQHGYLPEEIAEKKAAVEQSKATLEQTSLEARRRTELYRGKQISESEFEEAKFAFQAAQAGLEREQAGLAFLQRGYRSELIAATQAEWQKSQAQLDETKYWLEKNTIIAPFDGVIQSKDVEEGEWVTAGKTVAVLLDTQKIKIAIYIAEKYMGLVQLGLKGHVSLDAIPNRQFPAEIWAIIPQASAQSRNFEIRLVMDNPNGIIRPGMFCRVAGVLKDVPKTLFIHADAILQRQGQSFAIKVSEQQKAEYIPITLGPRDGDWFELLDSGNKLAEKDKVVVTNNPSVYPNAMLMIVREF